MVTTSKLRSTRPGFVEVDWGGLPVLKKPGGSYIQMFASPMINYKMYSYLIIKGCLHKEQ